MTKEFYQSVCFSLGLTLAVGLFQSWLHFQRGVDLYRLASFRSWFLVGDVIGLITAVLLLIYYHHKQYKATFWAGMLATVVSSVVLVYLLVATLYPILGQYYKGAILLGIITYLVYGATLVLSRASNRPWLKRTGILLVLVYGAQLVVLVWFMNAPPYPPNTKLDLIQQWLFLPERVVPVLLLLNFIDELRRSASLTVPTSLSPGLLTAKGMTVILAICSVVLGIQLLGDNYNHTHASAREIALAQPFEQGKYISPQGDTLLYRLLKPLYYDPSKRYPLVIGLPYSCRLDNIRQIDACPMAKWLATDENRKKYPAFVLVPRCPPYSGWGRGGEYSVSSFPGH
ncbi:hypothetical protein [Spirosoma foliorum]|uniref:hypothetical protein n=1 Tax=Spirosoma foliorum TaxID=2710596 RepID=UPI001F0B0C40|nr:hypothetical protein [Spirosoma foliorum]